VLDGHSINPTPWRPKSGSDLGLIAPLPSLCSVSVREWNRNQGAPPLPKPIVVIAFLLYLLVLFDLTLFAFPNASRDPNELLNLVPLKTVALYLHKGGWEMVVNILGNLAAFMPMGFLLPLLRSKRTSTGSIILTSAAVSILIEALQYASHRRVADIDDILLNAVGGVLGYLVYRILQVSWDWATVMTARQD